jgi:hypothetical protein
MPDDTALMLMKNALTMCDRERKLTGLLALTFDPEKINNTVSIGT